MFQESFEWLHESESRIESWEIPLPNIDSLKIDIFLPLIET